MRDILVIEDDKNLLTLMKHEFKSELNVKFIYADSYSEGMSQVVNRSFDLYIIDINLDGYSGLEILRVLQKEKDIDNRVIIMSASNDVDKRVLAYDLGASNFVLKPLNFEVLRSIIKKNLRGLESKETGELKFSNFIIKPERRTCFVFKDKIKQEIELTLIEFNLLYKLARSQGGLVTKEELSYLGKDQNHAMTFKALEMHIASLRKKLGKEFILTKRGIGYYLSDKY